MRMTNISENTLYLDTTKMGEPRFYFRADTGGASLLKLHGAATIFWKDIGRVWTLPATYPDGLLALQDLQAVFPKFKASKEANQVVNKLKAIPKQLKGQTQTTALFGQAQEFLFKFGLTRKMYKHQLEVFEYLQHYSTIAVGAEQGLGKTYLGLAHMAVKKEAIEKSKGQNITKDIPSFKGLVFCPVIVIPGWFYEALDYTQLRPLIYRGSPKKREQLREYAIQNKDEWDFIITNYEAVSGSRAKADLQFLMDQEFDVVLLDEISRLRGHKSDRSEALYTLTGTIPNRVGFSGTLSVGKPTDMFMPYTILNDLVFGANYYKFRNKYCKFSPYNKHIITGYKNLDTLKARVDSYSVFRKKEDCLDLPERTQSVVYYELGAKQQDLYNHIIQEEDIYLEGRTTIFTLTVTKLTKMLQVISGFMILSQKRDDKLCNSCVALLQCIEDIPVTFPWHRACIQHEKAKSLGIVKPERVYWKSKKNPKLEALDQLLDLNLRPDEPQDKVIIWAYYQKELSDIKALLKNRKPSVKFITPDDSDCAKKFEDPKENIQVFLGQISQGIGVTLNSAKVMIFYSASLNLEDWLQSLDRNHRIGQTAKTHVITLRCRDTVEEQVYDLLNDKRDVRDLLQSNNICSNCSDSEQCEQRMTLPYSRKCKHYALRKKAEEVTKFNIRKTI